MAERKMTEEELELVGVVMAEKERERNRAKFHDFGKNGETHFTYTRPVRRKDQDIGPFPKRFVHRFFKGKNVARSVFPKATVWEVMCLGPGEEICPFCRALANIQEYANFLRSKGKANRADELEGIIKSSKGKELRYWTGINYDPDTQSITGIETYRVPDYFFRGSILKLLTKKNLTIAQWIAKHPKLMKMKPVEREAHYLENCPPERGLPDDKKTGWKMCIEKSGKGINTKYDASFEEEAPLSKDSAEVKALKEAMGAGTFPDLARALEPMSKADLKKALGPINKLLIGKHREVEAEDEDGPGEEHDEVPDSDTSEDWDNIESDEDDNDNAESSDETVETGDAEDEPTEASDDGDWEIPF